MELDVWPLLEEAAAPPARGHSLTPMTASILRLRCPPFATPMNASYIPKLPCRHTYAQIYDKFDV